MKPSEIITADAQRNGFDPQAILTDMLQKLKAGTSVLLPKNNSVVFLTPVSRTAMEWNFFTVDKGKALEEAIKYFLEKISEANITTIYSMVDEPEVIRTIISLGVDFDKSDKPDYDWMGRLS